MSLIKAIFFSSLSVIPAYFLVCLFSGNLINTFFYLVMWIAYVIGLIGIVLIGIPTHLLLDRFKVKHCFGYVYMGFMAPAIFTWWTHPFGDDGFWRITWQGSFLGGFGALCAYVFWWFAVKSRST